MKPQAYRPFAQHRVVSGISFTLLLGAFVLLLLVAVSLPILKPVYLLSVKSTVTGEVPTSIATELRFGVWGLCASRSHSALSQQGWFSSDGVVCYGPMLGYDIPPEIATLAGVPPVLIQAVQQSLLVVLILHPIAAGFSFISFISALFLGSHGVSILTLIVAVVGGMVGAVVLAIDLALVIIAKNKISDLSPYTFTVNWGNGAWLVVTAVVMTWLAIVFLSARACYCCGVVKQPQYDDDDDGHHHHHHHHSSYY